VVVIGAVLVGAVWALHPWHRLGSRRDAGGAGSGTSHDQGYPELTRWEIPGPGAHVRTPVAWAYASRDIAVGDYRAKRYVWRCPTDADVALCVEVASDPQRRNDDGWYALHEELGRRHPGRYTCRALGDTHVNGRRVDLWHYTADLDGRPPAMRTYKIGTWSRGYGTAVWGECPEDDWDRWRDLILRFVGTYEAE
jgi:hypothetical protein